MYKELKRSKKNRVIAGVCGGIGQYFQVDPIFIRIIFIAFTFASGVGVLVYIILWLLVPDEEGFSYYENVKNEKNIKKNKDKVKNNFSSEIKNAAEKSKSNGPFIIGVVLIAIGLMFLSNNFFSFYNFFKLWPLILVVIGLGILLSSIERR